MPDALREVRALIERKGWRVSFPIEVRVAAADDNWLSTAYGRDSGYIAVHRYFREDHRGVLRGRRADHARVRRPAALGQAALPDAETLRDRYPRFDDFLRVRDTLDPERRFGNAYLERVLDDARRMPR